jgi:hypothetical protein
MKSLLGLFYYFLFLFWFVIFMGPGYPFAWFIGQIKVMGDGTGNESSTIEFMIWALVFAIIAWVSIVYGIVWFFY